MTKPEISGIAAVLHPSQPAFWHHTNGERPALTGSCLKCGQEGSPVVSEALEATMQR